MARAREAAVEPGLLFRAAPTRVPALAMTRSMLLPAAALGVALLAPSPARADEPSRPTRYTPTDFPPESARTGLILAGAGATAAWYGAGVGFSYLWPYAPGAKELRIPVAGPWMSLGKTGCADDDPGCSAFNVVLRAILTTMDAVGQTGGVAVMVEGIFLPTQAESAGPRKKALPPLHLPPREQSFSVRPVPFTAGRDAMGLGIVGVF